ncbi:MAG: AAA family ATPase, partial [Nocardioides sp.]
MHVGQLVLHDFRSYPDLDLELQPGVTALVGRNGQGKTNIVEAIDYLSRLSSHRVASDAPLVRAGCEQAVVRAAVVRDGRRATLEIEINPGRANRARINKSSLPRTRDLAGLVRTVLFAPDDLALVKGDPAERRRFLDDLLVLRAPRLAGLRADYERALKQRNSLLKTLRSRRLGGGYQRALSGSTADPDEVVGSGATDPTTLQ